MRKSKNKGMFLENIINNSIKYYWENKIAFIEKKETPIKFYKVTENKGNKQIEGKLFSKSTVDYIGMYQGKFICFEAKSSENDRFSYKNIKKHQINYLNIIEENGGLAYFIFYFASKDIFLLTKASLIKKHMSNHSSIKLEELVLISVILDLEFPGIINIFK
ncbi:Holliday junction resolvase RecU [Mycoplasmopsis glycophila]|uniref:Holliday junction resolvase RecU n=1 Tax=Mycoplasmopsis glycophila TaxID=171285 RepID=A0A449AV73_9BACT|nr:Holliday junction resolvase RecU [Mycoplasmopsis glycophila]VEU70372.1 penicillin-binding protein-related factor A recombinase [Mycoplasmopsis glycophila]